MFLPLVQEINLFKTYKELERVNVNTLQIICIIN